MPEVHLDLRAARQHLVEVQMSLPCPGRILRFALPAWTPGSYLIRDYVRTMEGLEVRHQGRILPVQRLAPAQWAVPLEASAPRAGDPIEIHYRILATELSVRTCHLSDEHGFLALSGVVVQVEGERWNPHLLRLSLPPVWEPFVALPRQDEGHWLARDFDQLIDTPIEAGPHPCHSFTVAGVPHRWVGWGGDLPLDDPQWLADVEQVCLACCRLMGQERPAAPQYLFVLHLLEQGYGGLEHDHASVLQYGHRALAQPEGRRKLLQLVAHEYLHQWNVRRLRPAELTPIDYDRATVVSSLWFAEGVTSYVDQLLPLAAGLGSEADLLQDLGADLSRYRLTPGRHRQSLRESSQEAWVKLYRQDAYSIDNQISYYLKGSVLALVLDLHLRRHGSWLGAVLQYLWRRHGHLDRGYQDDDLLAAFVDHAEDLSTLLPFWLNSTDDPDIETYLADVGLHMVPELAGEWFTGLQVESAAAGTLLLKQVLRDGPAEAAGLQVGDELLAYERQRLKREDDLNQLLRFSAASPAAPVAEVLYVRQGRVRQAHLVTEPPRVKRWSLEEDPQASEEQRQRRRRWLSLQP